MNKKFLTVIMAVFMCMATVVPVHSAKVAERSDYRAFIDYTPIDSYIIDGYTYIDADELVNYGFNVEYDNETSSLNITRIRYATPTYSKNEWEKSTQEKKSATIEDSNIKVYLDGKLTDSFYADGKTLIMIDSLVQYGEFHWDSSSWLNGCGNTVSVTIFQHELEEDLEKAENVVEIEYDAGVTFFERGTAKYKGQVNEENLPDGIGIAEFKEDGLPTIANIKYLGYFSDGKPDGLVYKETFYTVSRSYVHRRIHFIGEIDGSKESKREFITDYKHGTVTMTREPNFGVAILPIEEIPDWTGPEDIPDRTIYKKGCYLEYWYGRTGDHEYRIWSDGEDGQTIIDMCFQGAEYPEEPITALKRENEAIKYVTEFYEYEKGKLKFRDGYIHTASGAPTVLNSPTHGAGPMMPRISIIINEEELDFETAPVVENSRILVPMRAVFEKLGAEVFWDGENQSVTAVKKDRTVSLQINNKNMYLNDELSELDVEPVIINSTTMVPVRAVSEAFDANVKWHDRAKTVEISVPVIIDPRGI